MKIASKVKYLLASTAIVTFGAMAVAAPVSAGVYCPDGTYKDGVSSLSECGDTTGGDSGARGNDLMGILNIVINVALGVIGFIAVVMIIVGGVQYTTSAGDTAKVTKAKNTIMYGVIGLVIALLAYAIVNFVLANVFNAEG